MGSGLLLAVVFVFDFIAFVLAVAAVQKSASASIAQGETSSYCVYDSDIATGLGIGSLIFLSASQLHIMCATRCLCFGRALMPGSSRTIFLFITCWITFIIAGSCLVAGSVRNAYHTKYSSEHTHTSCEALRRGEFGAAAAFIVFTALFSELFYVSYSKVDEECKPRLTYV